MAPESPTGGSTGGGGFDISSINRNDLAVMIAGAVALISSFFPFYGASVSGGGFHVSSSVSAWHSYGFLGVLLLLLGAIAIAVKTFAAGSVPSLPIGIHVLAGGLAAVGTLILLIHGVAYSHPDIPGVDWGMKWGAYVIIIVGIAESVFAFLGARESGEQMPSMPHASPPPPAA